MNERMPMPPRLLVIDDDPELRQFLQDLLAEEGYAVDTGATMTEALALLDTHVYHLIITDLLAHSTQDPLRTAITLLQHAHPTPVMALTGWSVSPTEVARAGLIAFVPKPFDLTDLLTTIASCLTPEMSAEQRRWAEVLGHYCARFNAGDFDSCLALCVDNVRIVPAPIPQRDASTPAAMQGRAAVRAYLEELRRLYLPGLRFDDYLVHPQPNGLALRCLNSWESATALGERARMAATLHFQFVGERISAISAHVSELSLTPALVASTYLRQSEERQV